jgi:putative membrane protein
MTLGLFLIVINAMLLYFVAWVVPAFHIQSFGWAILGALIIGCISLVTNGLIGRQRVQVRMHRRKSSRRDDDDSGNGPVIDV